MKMTGESVVLSLLFLVFLPGGSVGKDLPCSNPIGNPQCCTCLGNGQPESRQCKNNCPAGYFVYDNNDTAVCLQSTTPTTVTMQMTSDNDNTTTGNSTTADGGTQDTSSNTSTDTSLSTTGTSYNTSTDTSLSTTDNTSSPPPQNRTVSTHLVRCQRCHESCETCNGSEPEDCMESKTGYERTTKKGTTTCELKDEGGISIAIIAGAAAAGAVVLLAVLVLVVCLCRRRRRRKSREMEQGPGMMMNELPDNEECVQEDRQKEKVDSVQSRWKSTEEPTYINYQPACPRPISIEQGHDKVTRYVRDPTAKMPLELSLTSSEKEELESLPEAPRLPPTKANLAEVKRRVGGAKQTRQTTAAGSSLPYPTSTVSCPELPKLPMEPQKEPRRNGPRSHGLRPVPSAVPKNEAESDPGVDYENPGLRVGLVAGAPRPEGAQAVGEGFVNSAADLNDVEDDDSQEEYCNQDAIDEIRAKGRIPNRSSTRSKYPAQAELYLDMQGGGARNSNGNLGCDDDQPVYGNEIADELGGGAGNSNGNLGYDDDQPVYGNEIADELGDGAGNSHRNLGYDDDQPVNRNEIADELGGGAGNSHGNIGYDDDQPVYGNEIADEPNEDHPYENISFPPPNSS